MARTYLRQRRGVKTSGYCADVCLLPLTMCGSVQIATQIDRQDDHANQYSAADDEPFGQIRIYECVEATQEKRAARGLDASAIFEPGFSDGEGARRPRN